MRLDYQKVVGGGYDDFWRFKGSYRVVRGGRNSKKSYTTARWYLTMMYRYPLANVLVIRRHEKEIRGSTFQTIRKAIRMMGIERGWRINNTTMVITRIATGQVIRFAGLDVGEKQTSIDVSVGVLCWLWLEEVNEIETLDKFLTVWHSIRGAMPEGYFIQATLTFNPWKVFWVKSYFFDRCNPELPTYDERFARDCLCKVTTIEDNEWATPKDWQRLVDLARIDPRRWRIERFGDWGVPGDIIYNNYQILRIPARGKKWMMEQVTMRRRYIKHICGLDWGFNHDTALLELYIDLKARVIWVVNEVVMNNKAHCEIAKILRDAGYQKSLIIADSADPKARKELRKFYGFRGMKPSRKGPDSVRDGIQYVRGFRKIYIFADCVHTIAEIESYSYDVDPETGETLEVPIKDNGDHCMDALRYGVTYYARGSGFKLGGG